ncbi:hypothetical protein CLV65_0958 [Pseudoscardovia suis]|nr:hypothetical protein CLV65_0958 [Pseudoscardovia suis]
MRGMVCHAHVLALAVVCALCMSVTVAAGGERVLVALVSCAVSTCRAGCVLCTRCAGWLHHVVVWCVCRLEATQAECTCSGRRLLCTALGSGVHCRHQDARHTAECSGGTRIQRCKRNGWRLHRWMGLRARADVLHYMRRRAAPRGRCYRFSRVNFIACFYIRPRQSGNGIVGVPPRGCCCLGCWLVVYV